MQQAATTASGMRPGPGTSNTAKQLLKGEGSLPLEEEQPIAECDLAAPLWVPTLPTMDLQRRMVDVAQPVASLRPGPA